MIKKSILFFIGFISIVGILLLYVKIALPNIDVPQLKIAITPERVERGRYLANSVCACMDCHSKRDWNSYSGPLVEKTLGQGGEEFNQQFGFPGRFYSKNITPFALQNWTDGEIVRAITAGVSKDGKALFPVMPYQNYCKLAKEDIYAIVTYLRTLQPIQKENNVSTADFPMNFILNTLPTTPEYSSIPNPKQKIAYGKYIFTAASCNECHTPKENGSPLEGMELAGGFKFPLATGGAVYSSNLTSDKATGIGNWSEDQFVDRFIAYADTTYKPAFIKPGTFNTVMPWMMYRSMKTEDLKAIYAYLKTIKPIENQVTKFVSSQK